MSVTVSPPQTSYWFPSHCSRAAASLSCPPVSQNLALRSTETLLNSAHETLHPIVIKEGPRMRVYGCHVCRNCLSRLKYDIFGTSPGPLCVRNREAPRKTKVIYLSLTHKGARKVSFIHRNQKNKTKKPLTCGPMGRTNSCYHRRVGYTLMSQQAVLSDCFLSPWTLFFFYNDVSWQGDIKSLFLGRTNLLMGGGGKVSVLNSLPGVKPPT